MSKQNLSGRAKIESSHPPKLTSAQRDALLSNLAEGMHTAFRQASDHPTAHSAWKAIREMPPEHWGRVVGFVFDGLFPADRKEP